ncbi:MAG TPA: gliding motility protein [Polyangiaceae bacterium]|nr:gliding motility protein [Polyangiaceae bacterium]
MQLDFAARELTLKLVYYGPALSGKTTNLQSLHDVSAADATGRLMTLETRDDRTLFFDLLPLSFEGKNGLRVRIKVFTVPGQVIHASTRRLVLQGADGVAFIADSRANATEGNAESFRDLRENLKQNGLNIRSLPLVIQFNKRDLPNARPDGEIEEQARQGKEPVYLAVATRREGVVETLMGLLHLTWQALDARHELSRKLDLESVPLLEEVLHKLGGAGSLHEVLATRVGAKQLEQVRGKS